MPQRRPGTAKAPRLGLKSRPVMPEPPGDLSQIVHELQVYQVELEQQNEELRNTQAQLEAVRAQYLDLYDLAPVGYWTLNAQGQILAANLKAASLLGLSRQALVQTQVHHHIAQEDKAHYRAFQELLFNTQEAQTCEVRMVCQDKRVIWVQHDANSVWDPEGRLTIRSVISDLTERHQAQALSTATVAVLAKGQMAAYIAHEINNPLMGIRNAFLLVSRGIPQDHPYFHYVGLIHQEIARIGSIVQMTYELHKPTNQAPSLVVVGAVATDINTLLAPKARAHQVALTLELPNPELCANLSADLLRQILFNLLQNAVEASPPGSTVTCRALRRRNHLCIQVIDAGPGIPPDLADRVFEPGFSTKQLAGAQMGLGIGLGSSRQLAKGMGGKLSFANHRDDTGCTFTLDLPLGGTT